LALGAAARPASAAPPALPAPAYSVIGATTLAEGERALVVSAGLPDLEVGLLTGLSTLSDVLWRARVQLGRSVRLGGGGVTLGATLRQQLAQFGGWRLALVSDPEVLLHLGGRDHPLTHKAAGLAFAVQPLAGGVVLDRLLHEDVRLMIGLQTAVNLFLTPETALHVPFFGSIGAEARLTPGVWFFARLDSGVDLYGPGGVTGDKSYLRARVGLSLL
jgi:hypothetical protein